MDAVNVRLFSLFSKSALVVPFSSIKMIEVTKRILVAPMVHLMCLFWMVAMVVVFACVYMCETGKHSETDTGGEGGLRQSVSSGAHLARVFVFLCIRACVSAVGEVRR